MTEEEKKVIDKLAEAWNAWLKLPPQHPDDNTEFRQGIHRLMEKVAARGPLKALGDNRRV